MSCTVTDSVTCLCRRNLLQITDTDSAFTLSLKLAQKFHFPPAVCALCPRCPGAVWPQRSHAGGVFLRAFVQPSQLFKKQFLVQRKRRNM
jgi:hypothetical protein